MRISNWGIVALLSLPILFMLAFFVVPFAAVVASSVRGPNGNVSLANYVTLVTDPYYLRALTTTLSISMWVTLITFLAGYPLGYFISYRIKGRTARRIAYALVVTPLFTSNVVRSFAWIVLLGRNGFVNDTLRSIGVVDKPLPLLFNKLSIVIGLSYVMLPFMVLSVAAVLQNIDPRLKEASRDLGAGATTTFFTVTLPLSVPGIVAGALMVFTQCVSAYVTPNILSGGREVVMSTLIFQQYASVMNFSFGATLAVGMLVAILVMWAMYRVVEIMVRSTRRSGVFSHA